MGELSVAFQSCYNRRLRSAGGGASLEASERAALHPHGRMDRSRECAPDTWRSRRTLSRTQGMQDGPKRAHGLSNGLHDDQSKRPTTERPRSVASGGTQAAKGEILR